MSAACLSFCLALPLAGQDADDLKMVAAAWDKVRTKLNRQFRLQITCESVQMARTIRGVGPNGEDFPADDLWRKSSISIVCSGENRRVDEVLDGAKPMQQREISILKPDLKIQFSGARMAINAPDYEEESYAIVCRRSKEDAAKLGSPVSTALTPYFSSDFINEFKESRRREQIVTLVRTAQGYSYEVDVEPSKDVVIRAARSRTSDGFLTSECRVDEVARSNGVFFPMKWKSTYYVHRLREQGPVNSTATFTVEKIQFPVDTPASEFELMFPPKTTVHDSSGPKERTYTIE